ncbi:MAG: rhomboid family intramembrane serine protease [Candidatus Roizmanbacteria bacterium]|nr:rhomboid family intramembrane serine protease [Candidatus Roizmanbacteria bacterium]
MFPIRDSHSPERFPFVNYLIIGITIFVFYLQLTASDFEAFVFQYGFIPADFDMLNPASYIPLLSAIFLHGGFMHIFSNLWFLHIFGDNVEGRFGHIPYLLFYVITGVAAAFAQYVVDPTSAIPMIGASGAISGVAGAYFALFRDSEIEAIIPIYFYIRRVTLPSWFFLGYWFVIQVFNGFGSLVTFGSETGGVAWFAHIGGFVAGWIIALIFGRSTRSPLSDDTQEVFSV